jgi:hypothetical protein
MLVVALALVVVMMRQLRRPETATRIEHVFAGNAVPAAAPEVVPSKAAVDPSRHGKFSMPALADDAPSAVESQPEVDANIHSRQFQELLTLAGWDAARLAQLGDGQPLSDEHREELLDLVRRLKTFDSAELVEWTRTDLPLSAIAARPDEHRGELIRLTGRVRKVERRMLPPDMAARLELPAFVECQFALDAAAGVATIITARIPDAWNDMDQLDEPATASGVFVKMLPSNGQQTAALFVSPDIAWHPREMHEPYVSFGPSLLGSLGMDVGLLDVIEQRRSIQATEREAFYQMLDAVGRAGANQLIRFASGDLDAIGKQWAAEAERLRKLVDQSSDAADDAGRKRLRLAHEVLRRMDEDRYSVAPLFNDPENQVGQLVTLEGVARRAVRIDVGTSVAAATTPSDVRRRFGIDHYFEMDLFTDDSQNNPVVFCVRELPPGFPTGESIREPVRLAGFFFKSWSFRSRQAAETGSGGDAAATRQFAPLLVGRGPIWLQTPSPAGTGQAGWILGGLFVLVLAAIWAAVWWFGRGGRRFGERALPERLSLPTGQSLDGRDNSTDGETQESSSSALGNTGGEV